MLSNSKEQTLLANYLFAHFLTFPFPPPLPEQLNKRRQDGHQNNAEDDVSEVVFDDGQCAEKIAKEQETGDPGDAPHHVVGGKPGVAHGADARHKWRKGADDGHEPRVDDGFSAVFFVELLGFVQVFHLQEPVAPAKGFRPDVFSDVVIDQIAQDGRCDQQQAHQHNAEAAVRLGNDGARRKQQRIPRQNRGDHQPRFRKNDEEKDQVSPGLVIADNLN